VNTKTTNSKSSSLSNERENDKTPAAKVVVINNMHLSQQWISLRHHHHHLCLILSVCQRFNSSSNNLFTGFASLVRLISWFPHFWKTFEFLDLIGRDRSE